MSQLVDGMRVELVPVVGLLDQEMGRALRRGFRRRDMNQIIDRAEVIIQQCRWDDIPTQEGIKRIRALIEEMKGMRP